MIWTGGFQGRVGTAGGRFVLPGSSIQLGQDYTEHSGSYQALTPAVFGPLLHSLFANIRENKCIRSEFELILVPSI